MAILGSLRLPTAQDRWNSLRHPVSPQSLLFYFRGTGGSQAGQFVMKQKKKLDNYIYLSLHVCCTRQWHYFKCIDKQFYDMFGRNFIIVILMYPMPSLTSILDILGNFQYGCYTPSSCIFFSFYLIKFQSLAAQDGGFPDANLVGMSVFPPDVCHYSLLSKKKYVFFFHLIFFLNRSI